jgi:hypothetical protein
MDSEEGLWACPWIGPTAVNSACRVRDKETGQFLFEPYDGTNRSWNSSGLFRSVPKGYENKVIETP